MSGTKTRLFVWERKAWDYSSGVHAYSISDLVFYWHMGWEASIFKAFMAAVVWERRSRY